MTQPLVIQWPGGEHAFRIGIGQCRVIQQKTECGPEHLLNKIKAGVWTVDELREILRNGLIGGGMAPVEALKIIDKTFDEAPGIKFKAPAMEVLSAYLFGPPDDTVGEPLPVIPTPANKDQTGNGSSANTTA